MDRTNAREKMYESPGNIQDKSSNNIVTGDRASNSESAIVARKQLVNDKNALTSEVSENFLTALSADDDIPHSQVEISNGNIHEKIETDSRGPEWIDRDRQQDHHVTEATSYNSLKRTRTAEDNEELLAEDFVRVRTHLDKEDTKIKHTPPSSNTSNKNEYINSVIEAESLDLDDERCPICLDTPYGLMVLCKVCRRGLHSACAKKGGGGTYTGKRQFYRPF